MTCQAVCILSFFFFSYNESFLILYCMNHLLTFPENLIYLKIKSFAPAFFFFNPWTISCTQEHRQMVECLLSKLMRKYYILWLNYPPNGTWVGGRGIDWTLISLLSTFLMFLKGKGAGRLSPFWCYNKEYMWVFFKGEEGSILPPTPPKKPGNVSGLPSEYLFIRVSLPGKKN